MAAPNNATRRGMTMNAKFKTGDMLRSDVDGSIIEVVDVYQGQFSLEYKIRWTEKGSEKTRYVMASDIDGEFNIDADAMKFVYGA
jgi:hypothetical protein